MLDIDYLLFIWRKRIRNITERYKSAEFHQKSAEEQAHAALAELGYNAIMRDALLRTHAFSFGRVSRSGSARRRDFRHFRSDACQSVTTASEAGL